MSVSFEAEVILSQTEVQSNVKDSLGRVKLESVNWDTLPNQCFSFEGTDASSIFPSKPCHSSHLKGAHILDYHLKTTNKQFTNRHTKAILKLTIL